MIKVLMNKEMINSYREDFIRYIEDLHKIHKGRRMVEKGMQENRDELFTNLVVFLSNNSENSSIQITKTVSEIIGKIEQDVKQNINQI